MSFRLLLYIFWFTILVFVTNRKQSRQLLKQEQNLSWEVYASKHDNLFLVYIFLIFYPGGYPFIDAEIILIRLEDSLWSFMKVVLANY